MGGDRDELLLCPIRVLKSIWVVQNSTILKFPICSNQQLRGSNGCPKAPFHFGSDWSSTTFLSLLPIRTADQLGSKLTRSGRLLLHCCLEGSTQSNRSWRLVSGHLGAPSQPSTFSITLVVAVQNVMRFTSPFSSGVVTLVQIFSWRSVLCGHLEPHV